jgi:hypothetical protein
MSSAREQYATTRHNDSRDGSYYRTFHAPMSWLIGLRESVLLFQLRGLQRHFTRKGTLIPHEGQLWFYQQETRLMPMIGVGDTRTLGGILGMLEQTGVLKTTKFGLPFKRHFQVREGYLELLIECSELLYAVHMENDPDPLLARALAEFLVEEKRWVARMVDLLPVNRAELFTVGCGISTRLDMEEIHEITMDRELYATGGPVAASPAGDTQADRPRRMAPKPVDGDRFAARAREKHSTAKPPAKDADHPLLQFWNTLPNTRHHDKPGTKARAEACKLLRELERCGLSKRNNWDPNWMKSHGVTMKHLTQPWSDEQIRRALAVVNDMLGDGMWPGPAMKGMGLAKVIYDGDVGKSLLTIAKVKGEAEPIKQKRTDATMSKMDDDTHALMMEVQGIVEDIRGDLLPGEEQDSIQVAKAIDAWWCSFEKDMDVAWDSPAVLGEHYREWVVREYSGFKKIRVGHLAPGRKMFAAFVEYMNEYFAPYDIPQPRSFEDPRAQE